MLLLSLAALVPNWPMGGVGNRLHGAAQEGVLCLLPRLLRTVLYGVCKYELIMQYMCYLLKNCTLLQ